MSIRVEPNQLVKIRVKINGEWREGLVEPRKLLVHFLRDLGFTSVHVGCDTSHCGACTVLMNGVSVKSCTVLAIQADGSDIVTLEGLSGSNKGLHIIQEAFWEKHAAQCGYCTPGMIMQTSFLLRENPEPSEDDIRRGLSGVLCRCTGYQNIVDAVRLAATRLKELKSNVN